MPILEIDGVGKVDVGDGFTSMAPADQDSFVNEITQAHASGMKSSEPPAPATLPVGAPRISPSSLGMSQGLTANFGDELFAGALTPIEMGIAAYKGDDAGKGIGQRASEAYTRALDRERMQLHTAEAEHPVATMAGNIAGGVMAGSKAAKGGLTLLNAAKPTVASMLGRGAAEGAAYGGLYGAGAGEGSGDRLDKALSGAAVGALVGGGVGSFAGRQAAKSTQAEIPTTQALKEAGGAAYKSADDAGIILAPDVARRAAENIRTNLAEFGYHPGLQPRVGVVLDELNNAAQQPVTLKGYDVLRRLAGSVSKSIEPSERSLGKMMQSQLDDALNKVQPADVIAGNADQGIPALRDAQKLWQQFRKSEMVDTAMEKAANRAGSTGSGGNIDNTTRQNLRGILDNPKKSRSFSDDEMEALKAAVKGSRGQNMLRTIGKLAPTNPLMSAMGGGAGFAAGGAPGAVAIPALGMIAKAAADRMGASKAAQLSQVIRNSGNAVTPSAIPQLNQQTIGALLQIMAQQGNRVPIGMNR